MISGLDLFSGYGGITIALSEWVRPVAYCEIERYSQAIILSRIADGSLPNAPIWDDVTTLNGNEFRGKVDIIYGGFPCTDISVAGNGEGLGGKRSGLFTEICRLAEEISPSWIFLENVPAIRTKGLLAVVRSLTNLGYDCRWTCVSAAEVGAPHKRERFFLLGINANNGRRFKIEKIQKRKNAHTKRNDFWTSKPHLDRMANGCAFRMDRIKALGNGVVPSQVKEAFERLIGFNPDSGNEGE